MNSASSVSDALTLNSSIARQVSRTSSAARSAPARRSGTASAVVHADRLAELRADAVPERLAGAERAAELVRETWRAMEEFNVNASLTLEALFIRLRRELGSAVPVAS